MTIAPRLRDNALVARSCPPGTSLIKSEYRVLRYMVRPCVGPTGLPRWGPRLSLSDQHGLSFLNLLVGTWQQAKVTGLGPGPPSFSSFWAGEGVGDG